MQPVGRRFQHRDITPRALNPHSGSSSSRCADRFTCIYLQSLTLTHPNSKYAGKHPVLPAPNPPRHALYANTSNILDLNI